MDISNKKKKIHSLVNEVNDFHPVLHELFSRHPKLSVEHTHGPHEMGADFILTKTDEILDRETRIGVIVKTGKIKQNHQDIENQIKECSLARKVEGGKKIIIINEIWVITNESVSHGAKDKIHHSFNDKSIHILEDIDIIELIDKHYPDYWTDLSIEIGNFFKSISEKSNILTKQIDMLDISSVSDFDIDQKFHRLKEIIRRDPGRPKTPKTYNLNSILDDQFIFIQGVMGTGKSKLIAKITEKYSSNENFINTKTIPFPTSFHNFLSEFNSDIHKVIEFIQNKIKTPDINYPWFRIISAIR